MRQTLGEYALHITNDQTVPAEIDPPDTSNASAEVENPVDWPRDHHNIPDYRPLNRNLAGPERPNGMNPGEVAFIAVMFTGVFMNAVSQDR